MTESQTVDELEKRLRAEEDLKHGSYDKRTEHLADDGRAVFINRLILEDSPYLLQHAHNPVNWYPWGEEAFARARQENKPVFLSIGYSTCHWCHVMEVESFDNVEVARLLNADFIAIKMDREQYPDIDEVYMTGVQLISGQGGWPMSNFLLPDGNPFFAATYFPRPTFIKLLQQIVGAWRDKYEELETSARGIGEAIDRILSERKDDTGLPENLSESMADSLLTREDKTLGGLSGAPKFPQEPLLLFMLDRARRYRDGKAFGFVVRALDGMGKGGIYDQVGGGFHRYSVDSRWLVPHFEKMLYNQSQLGLVYLQAYLLSGDAFYRRICEQTLDYVLGEMQLPEGGFYSATDADSEGAEGVFFLWTLEQLHEVLDDHAAELVATVYGLSEAGNFEGSNILHLTQPLHECAEAFQPQGSESFYHALDAARERLWRARSTRQAPLRDDKLIVAWSAAMATTLTAAGHALGREDYVASARRAIENMLEQNCREDGRLWRIHLDGTSSIDGQLEDYGNLMQALLALFDVTGEMRYLEKAHALSASTLTEFWDAEEGGFYLGPAQQAGPRLTRSRNAGDGATISPVATALKCLQMLLQRSAILAQLDPLALQESIDRCRRAVAPQVKEHPLNHGSLLQLLDSGPNAPAVHGIYYAGNGLARVRIRREPDVGTDSDTLRLRLEITLQSPWHILASGDDGAEPHLQLALAADEPHWQSPSVSYPAAKVSLAQADGSALEALAGSVLIEARCGRQAGAGDALSPTVALELTLQLCNDQHCLLPETLQLRV